MQESSTHFQVGSGASQNKNLLHSNASQQLLKSHELKKGSFSH